MKSNNNGQFLGSYSDNYIPYVVKEGSPEISLSGRYICVYMRDKIGNYSYIYGSHHFFEKHFKQNMKTSDVHKYACEAAFTGKRVSYDWFDNNPIPTFFNTVIIPLSDSKGNISSLLFAIKALDELLVQKNNTMVVAEKTGQSFVRIIMQAREEEKRLMTSAIHDQLGNFSVRSNSLIELLREDIETKTYDKALEKLYLLQQTFQESVHAMKEIITSLRPIQIDSVGLNAAIKELVDKIQQTTSVKIKYCYKIKEKTLLSKNTKLVLYRAVQEALSNTIKYAQAKNLKVELKEDSTSLYLFIKDDGKGFKPQVHRSVKSLGLAGMKENIASLKGTMKLTSKPGEGTAIFIKCPKFVYSR